ncbi:septum formation initiator family protein, partial [Burkholderia multivorans]
LVTFLPSINSALKQAQQIAALNNEIDATRSEVEALREKNEDLKDPTHIARKAREEQYYVEKGKNAVIVTNQETSEDDDSDTVSPQRSQPWYLELLESIEEVGNSSNTTGTGQ